MEAPPSPTWLSLNDKPSKPELAEKTDMLKNYFELPVFIPSDF